MNGLVIKSTGSNYTVEQENGMIINCKIRGTFRLKGIDATNPIAVGDKIVFEVQDESTGYITKIADRKNYIVRKSKKLSKQSQIIAANIDRAFLVVTLMLPKTSTGFIDRFLITAEAYSIPVTILFNKSDLFDEDALNFQKELAALYEPLGYPCYLISSFNKNDVAKIKSLMKGKVNLFSGHSGVGKSTLINAIEPTLKIRTAKISLKHFKGIHTTTFAEMHKLSEGGYIIDTPGIREFGMYDFSKNEVSHYFPEMRALFNKCQFDNCLHINEPNCAVKKAVEEGKINPSRYYNYLSVIEGEDIFK